MRRIPVAALVAAIACGGKSTVTATPEIKAGATGAQQSLGEISTNTLATVGLEAIGEALGVSLYSQNVAAVDLRGLPAPDSLTGAAGAFAMSPDAIHALRASASSAGTVPMNGCVRSDASGHPAWIQPGLDGCGALDHVEVDYDDREVVNVTYSPGLSGYDLTMSAVNGPWAGTHFHYAASYGEGTTQKVNAAGTLVYSSPLRVIDSDFSIAYELSTSHTPLVSDTAMLTVNGTATDHVAVVRGTASWALSAAHDTTTIPYRTTRDWTGSMDIGLLAADGGAVVHSVRFDGLAVHAVALGLGGFTVGGSGTVEWDGAVCGNLVATASSLNVAWTDGTESPFDASRLYGAFGPF